MKNRFWSFIIIILIYAAAVGAGAAVLVFLPRYDIFVNMFLADFAATVTVYISSLIFGNASTYDPYWSVAPVFLTLGFYLYGSVPFSAHHLFVLIPFFVWAARLTYNWAKGFENLRWQDWRYTKLRADHPKIYQFICFTGIMLMPTVLVYLGTAPLWFILSSTNFSVFHLAGGAVITLAVIIQATADEQMRKFRRENRGKCIDTGLWKYSRHPNYFGEIMIWWGIAVAALASGQIASLLGAVLITCLFMFISIPMMEKHILSTRPEYGRYRETVSALIPWKRKEAEDEENCLN